MVHFQRIFQYDNDSENEIENIYKNLYLYNIIQETKRKQKKMNSILYLYDNEYVISSTNMSILLIISTSEDKRFDTENVKKSTRLQYYRYNQLKRCFKQCPKIIHIPC